MKMMTRTSNTDLTFISQMPQFKTLAHLFIHLSLCIHVSCCTCWIIWIRQQVVNHNFSLSFDLVVLWLTVYDGKHCWVSIVETVCFWLVLQFKITWLSSGRSSTLLCLLYLIATNNSTNGFQKGMYVSV